MKKIISLALILVMCLGVLTACNPVESIKGFFGIGGGEEYDLDAAKTYLKQIYIDYLKKNETDTSFDLVTTLDINGVKYSVNWVSNTEVVTLVPSEDGTKVTATFEKGDKAVDYVLTATITAPDGTNTEYALNLVVPESNIISISTALAAKDGDKVTVKGTVIDIGTAWDSGYKNISVTIQDANGDKLYLYRLKTQVELGDIIIATGEMATYNNARQMAAGGTAEIEGKDPNFVVSEAKEYTIPEALLLPDLTLVIVKGTITKINTPYSADYDNISVTISDAEGNTLYIHRLKGNFELGDIITVTGKMTTYNEAKQINAGATAEKTGHDDTVVEVPEIPTEEGKVTLYFTLKSDSEEIPSYAVPYITGGAWNWADWCAKGAQKFTHLEGTDIWYVITDKDLTSSDEYKILLNVSVANGHGWKNPSVAHVNGANGKYVYEAGQQLVDLGEHGFANINVADIPTVNWVLVGTFNSWNGSNGIALTSVGNGIFESEYLDVPEDTQFKITNGMWMSDDGGVEIANPTNANNFKIETAGKYKVRFNVNTGEVTVVEEEEDEPVVDPVAETIVMVNSGNYVTATSYTYTSKNGSTKDELKMSSSKDDAVSFTVRKNDDDTVTLVTSDSKFLYADGTNVRLVDEEGDHTKFVLEDAEGGYYVKCANATYSGKAQYLEVYSGYLTCFSFDSSKTAIYLISFE